MEIIQVKTKKICNSTPISCNPNILNWFCDNISISYKNKQKSLSSNLIDELTILFGEQNKTMILEKRTKIWVLQYHNLIFNVFTSKGKGTYIEIINLSYEELCETKHVDDIIIFLTKLHSLINMTLTGVEIKKNN